ncbi:hypothetical protein [Chelativorans intermedius]|uniref:Uncharacterized protein n=1 Tax=Chelativorans intermedius TaxID=515947 RepID=A0ABV6DDS1_9HYPH|nr:hypothetical protein [Chelativorans intermedius]
MPEEDEAIVDVGDIGFIHIQRQFQMAFQKGRHSARMASAC